MGPQGKWVEIQIRTQRMDRIAEHGFAAHYKYKGAASIEQELEKWLEHIREVLHGTDTDAFEFLDEFKLNLFSSEIIVFSPKGEMFNLPKKATVLDFAYEIHTHLGDKCIGAKINQNLVSLSHELASGDQIEILTAENQEPKIEWLNYVTTAKAKSKIKNAFKLDKSNHIVKGKEIVEQTLKVLNLPITSETLKRMTAYFNLSNKDQLYSYVGMGFIKIEELNKMLKHKAENLLVKYWNLTFQPQKKRR